jgi:hypothetical protein
VRKRDSQTVVVERQPMVPCLHVVVAMRVLVAFGVSLLLAACPGQPPDTSPDATTADAADGGVMPGDGLTLTFTAAQTIPGPASPDIVIEEVRLRAMSVRALGDTDPGATQTTESDYELRWKSSEQPAPIVFASARVGEYSQVSISLDADGDGGRSIEINGEVVVGGDTKDFEIESTEPMQIDVGGFAVPLVGGAAATIALRADLGAVVTSVDWSQVMGGEDTLAIDDDDPELALVRAALASAFSVPVP